MCASLRDVKSALRNARMLKEKEVVPPEPLETAIAQPQKIVPPVLEVHIVHPHYHNHSGSTEPLQAKNLIP